MSTRLDEENHINNPVLFFAAIRILIERMKNKEDYTKPTTNTVPSSVNPGRILFTPQVIKIEDSKINLQVVDKLLSNPYLIQSELMYFRFYRELLNTASLSYNNISDVERIYTQNILHLKQEIERLKGLGNIVKLAILIPISSYTKSNFWCTLYFINLCSSNGIDINYGINSVNNFINSLLPYQPSPDFYKPQANEKIIIIVCDDVSYSGQQLSGYIHSNNSVNNNKYVLFLSLLGYSENAHARITKSVNRKFPVIFGNGAITPLAKISIRFNDPPQMNDLLYKQAADNGMYNGLCSLIMHDMFYINEKDNNLILKSTLLQNLKYVDYNSGADSNGSLQYLPFKYPDSLSTVDNMCLLNRQENIIIFRISRIINFMDDKISDPEKINKLACIMLKKFNLISLAQKMHINLVTNYNRVTGSVNIFKDTLSSNNINIDNSLISEYIPKLRAIINETNTKYYNNLQLFKFIKANNKIHKFNKKHLIELIGPKNNYQKFNNHQFLIRNCTNNIDEKLIALQSYHMFCNQNCTGNTFYKKINWK